ncbi:uncharacterized protein B0H18DRAFT_1130537 [Fomitopsis serialis]|uniref:uncharacterized protein n=1 Tax=Fomitopsis serialis TaxID=139415 RepID=UPI002007E7B4|nr:uncharacterized protein B0H18DRAFT_1130537 [Neoantrodia serialis]KAH9910198.1 hypothetical protein B0H18DRAFT_1130537 [Neoantrodia serialis]
MAQVESALMEVATGGQANFFSNKQFAPKWDALMAILQTLRSDARPYYEETRRIIWARVKSRLSTGPAAVEEEEDDEQESFIPVAQLRESGASAAGSSSGAGMRSTTTTGKAIARTPTSLSQTAKQPSSKTPAATTPGKATTSAMWGVPPT